MTTNPDLNHPQSNMAPGRVLVIAGSDSSGGAYVSFYPLTQNCPSHLMIETVLGLVECRMTYTISLAAASKQTKR